MRGGNIYPLLIISPWLNLDTWDVNTSASFMYKFYHSLKCLESPNARSTDAVHQVETKYWKAKVSSSLQGMVYSKIPEIRGRIEKT